MRQDFGKIVAGAVLFLGLLSVTAHSFGSDAADAVLEAALRESGWEVKRLADGSIELRREPLVSGAREPDEVTDVTVPERKESDPEAVIWHRLRDSGWRVEKGPDGSTFLYPPVPESETKPDPEERRSGGAPNASTIKGLDARLAERGWRVARTADGSLLLYPKAVESPAAPVSSIQSCRGVLPPIMSASKIALPVDRWGQAKEIAESWLSSVGSQALTVGRVRRILRIYVVSIVDSNPPHRLRHQIAINAADGRVVVLN